MTTCAYCNRPATHTIVANPHKVCYAHALEFWTGLLGYAHERLNLRCVRGTTFCSCADCQEAGAARLRTLAINRVGLPPGDHVDFGVRLAS